MRELLLLRHAEALPAGPDERDRDRPLSRRGQDQAQALGAWLAARPAPDTVLCSPARRARMTFAALAVPMPEPQIVAGIYGATPGELLALLEAHSGDARRPMLVGHNPGLEQLLALLTAGRSGDARGLAPANLAWIGFTAGAFEPGHGRVQALWTP